MTRQLLKLVKTVGWMALGGLFSLLLVYVLFLEGQAELKVWHEVTLDEEFGVDKQANSLADYLEIEDRVFTQLETEIVDQVPVNQKQIINRFSRGSASNPKIWPRNWNRTFELPVEKPKAAVLLLHGMSDSPYSLRKLGQQLSQRGAWVLGLRSPGHGTAPSGLNSLRWQDMARAVELAMQHLATRASGRPIYIVGYSAGGALAVHYALTSLENTQAHRAAGLVLISPAIAVTPLAALAVWQARLGRLLGLDKLQWSDIKPEYDPFKYNSFTVNAGDQTYRLSMKIASLLKKYQGTGLLEKMPPILALQSGVDATVSSSALVDKLFAQLPFGGHELTLFDINRNENIELLLQNDPEQAFGPILQTGVYPFTLSVLGNRTTNSNATHLLRKQALSEQVQTINTPAQWPENVYSLSHVALPFSQDDPLYGSENIKGRKHIQLGDLALRGERGTISLTPGDMLRLRWNPFYEFMQQKILMFMQLENNG